MAGESDGGMPLCKWVGAVVLLFATFAFGEVQPGIENVPAHDGLTCEKRTFRHIAYDVVLVDLNSIQLSLFWKDDSGEPLGNFTALSGHLKKQGKRLVFAINSGIYARDYTPLGLHIEQGGTLEPLNRKRGGGNFFLKPNGVFYVDAQGGHIAETEVYAQREARPRLAVQSGPLLLDAGEIHPVFEPESDSRHIRNGVGIIDERHVIFAITRLPVNLYDFASFFKEEMGCASALYLDGAISGMYAPGCGRKDSGSKYVGMIAIVEDAVEEADVEE